MTQRITKAEAVEFRRRWQRVNAREEEELRCTTLEVRLQQFNTLLGWAHQLGWAAALGEGEAEVRQRWARLRKAHDDLERRLPRPPPRRHRKRKT